MVRASRRGSLGKALTCRANRAQFMDVALRHINEDEEIVQVNMPTIQGDQDSNGERLNQLEDSLSLSGSLGEVK